MNDLNRFLEAQERKYDIALSEIKSGRKRGHWMWYIFPQIVGLGYTEASYYYGIKSIDEAKEYLNHPVLGNRLREISNELLKLAVNDINSIFRNPDDLKLKSSMTLFSQMEEREDNIFRQVIDKFFQGVTDNKTLKWTTLKTEADCANILIGAIAGDIIGSMYELHNIRKTEFPLFAERSKFTDDTVMTIAIADWLLTGDSLLGILQDYGNRYEDAGYDDGMFYCWLKANDPQPYNSFGNGSAMRVSFVGWAFETLEKTLQAAKISAEITHNHIEGIKGAQATASAIYLARNGKSKEVIKSFIEQEFGYDLNRTCDEIRPYYDFNETCQGTVPEAIIAFLESTDFESAIRLAVSLGGDSDTLACITGGIAEAYYKEIPLEIKQEVLRRIPDEFEEVIRQFYLKYVTDTK